VRPGQEDPAWLRWTLIGAALAAIGLLVVVPVANVFAEALADGVGAYWDKLTGDPDTLSAIGLTFIVVPVALVLNVVFGVAAAWCISRFRFPGRSLLTALIDLPFSVSPVVAGLMFVLIFGIQGWLGKDLRRDGYSLMPWVISTLGVLVFVAVYALRLPSNPRARRGLWRYPLPTLLLGGAALFAGLFFLQDALGIWPEHKSLKVLFATPSLILATAFVTFPFVARELIPMLDATGPDEELAALSLGASGWQMFWHVTVPNAKWALVYGVVLCNARAMGEFGAVYVVSGRITGETDTMPLRIEKLFQEYDLPGSFAVASLLTLLALVTLVVKARLERTVHATRRGGPP
jgi:sulfate transport system permease protein